MPGAVVAIRRFCLDQLGGRKSNMFGGDLLAFFIGGGDQSTAGEMVGFAQQASRALLDSGDGRFGEELRFDTGDSEMVGKIKLHLFQIDPFEMASGDDA